MNVVVSQTVMVSQTDRTHNDVRSDEVFRKEVSIGNTSIMLSRVPSMIESTGSGGEYGLTPWALIGEHKAVQVNLIGAMKLTLGNVFV